MAKLVAVCRDEEAFPFERRQIPLMIEDTLTVCDLDTIPKQCLYDGSRVMFPVQHASIKNLFSRFLLNLFLTTVPILCPLKTPANQRFYGVFMGNKLEAFTRNKLNVYSPEELNDASIMVMEIPETVITADCVNSSEVANFKKRYMCLTHGELHTALIVCQKDLFGLLAVSVPCVGCRRSVERLYNQLWESCKPAIEPLVITTAGALTLSENFLKDSKLTYALFYIHGSNLNDIVDTIPKSKRNRRCILHSLETHKARASGWMDVWDLLSQDCRDEVVLIDSDALLDTLENYLRKHRFCSECKSKVMRAYSILAGDIDGDAEKGYCAALYEGLKSCPKDRHIHVTCDTDFIAHLIGRAEPELAGGSRERHARTIDIAQEEVLTCLGIHLWERLHRLWQKLRAEEQTWQMLFYLGIEALRKRFETAVEEKQGITQLELVVEEISEAERAKEKRKQNKRLKRKKRKENKAKTNNDNKLLSEEISEDKVVKVEDEKPVELPNGKDQENVSDGEDDEKSESSGKSQTSPMNVNMSSNSSLCSQVTSSDLSQSSHVSPSSDSGTDEVGECTSVQEECNTECEEFSKCETQCSSDMENPKNNLLLKECPCPNTKFKKSDRSNGIKSHSKFSNSNHSIKITCEKTCCDTNKTRSSQFENQGKKCQCDKEQPKHKRNGYVQDYPRSNHFKRNGYNYDYNYHHRNNNPNVGPRFNHYHNNDSVNHWKPTTTHVVNGRGRGKKKQGKQMKDAIDPECSHEWSENTYSPPCSPCSESCSEESYINHQNNPPSPCIEDENELRLLKMMGWNTEDSSGISEQEIKEFSANSVDLKTRREELRSKLREQFNKLTVNGLSCKC